MVKKKTNTNRRINKAPSRQPKANIPSKRVRLLRRFQKWITQRFTTPIRQLLARRPHRSFRRTRRRDYARTLQLPGYISFTVQVWQILWQQRKLFGLLLFLYVALSIVLVGVGSQDSYRQLSDILQNSGNTIFSGGWGEIGKAGLLLAAGISGSFTPQLTESQQIYSGFTLLLIWLTTVWLLRSLLAGKQPRLRDGIYNAGSPIVPTAMVALMLVLQLLPIAFAVIGYGAATATGILSTGAIAMIFWFVAGLLSLLSIYWITSTLIAMVVVTLPGMYPLQAIRTAGDLVVGRRTRILLRLLWLAVMVILFWSIIVIPVILLDGWVKSLLPAISWLPIVPFTVLIITSASTIWVASYIYILYRKVVDDDAAPA